jgi:uncharacterized protein YqjF (DUF2071 family)
VELNEDPTVEVRLETAAATVIASAAPRAPTWDDRRALQKEPEGSPVMYQTWRKLLFLHWEWEPAALQELLPPGLFIDVYGAQAYVGVTPFFMNDVRASMLPEIPGASDFLELNVRTYVHDRNGAPGVWFFSLDCNRSLAVWMAKIFYSLPYHSAEMEARESTGLIEYRCRRRNEREEAVFHYRKEPETVTAQPGSLPFFLAERYLLYSYSNRAKKLYCARVHHAPWQLFRAHLGKFDETMLRVNHLDPKLRPPDHRWFAEPARVKIFPLHEAP